MEAEATTATAGTQTYLFRFVQRFEEFRIPEIESLAQMFGIKLDYDPEEAKLVSSLVEKRPFLKVKLESDEAATTLAKRAISLQGIYTIWGEGSTIEEAVEDAKKTHSEEEQEKTFKGTTFHFKIDIFGVHVSYEEQLEMIGKTNSLHFWDVAKVKLHHPQHSFRIVKDLANNHVYLCKKVSSGARKTIDKFSLKKRTYLGTTSMNPELSLFMANQGKIRPGTISYDPFVGTGSISLVCSYFGAMSLGADIAYLTLHGTQKGKSVKANYEQYDLKPRLLDLLLMDQAHSFIRNVPFVDAIVCDPPYGVRAGARKVGLKTDDIPAEQFSENRKSRPHGSHSFTQCVPYSVPEMLKDLLSTAAKLLVMGGRLVFWMPSTIEYRESDLPRHPCFKLISNSLQQITLRWGRRLITMEKCAEYDPAVHENLTSEELGQIAPTHADFADYALRRGEAGEEGEEEAAVATSDMDPRLLEAFKKKGELKAARREKKLKSKRPKIDKESKDSK